MPIRALVTADAASTVTCINEMFTYLRNKSSLLANVGDVSATQLQRLRTLGYKGYGYDNGSGRIDAACIFHVDAIDHPIPGFPSTLNGPAPWMVIVYLAFRPSAMPDTLADHQTYFWRAIKLALPDAVNNLGAIGTRVEYDPRNQQIHNILANNFPTTAFFELIPEISPGWGDVERCWLPIVTGLPAFTAVTSGIS